MSIEARLAELGIVLPQPAAPVASYVPVVIAGGLAHVSGQLPFIDDDGHTWRFTSRATVKEAWLYDRWQFGVKNAAHLCTIGSGTTMSARPARHILAANL